MRRRKRAKYWDSPEVQAWIELEADRLRDLQLFDRAMRRRSRRYRERHLHPDDADAPAAPAARTRRVGKGRPFALEGYLNFSHEDAARALAFRADGKPGEWEGPRARFDLLLGEQRVWTGAPADGPCGVCRGADLGGYVGTERVAKVVCLWCGRSNLDRELGPVSPKPKDPAVRAAGARGALRGGKS